MDTERFFDDKEEYTNEQVIDNQTNIKQINEPYSNQTVTPVFVYQTSTPQKNLDKIVVEIKNSGVANPEKTIEQKYGESRLAITNPTKGKKGILIGGILLSIGSMIPILGTIACMYTLKEHNTPSLVGVIAPWITGGILCAIGGIYKFCGEYKHSWWND